MCCYVATVRCVHMAFDKNKNLICSVKRSKKKKRTKCAQTESRPLQSRFNAGGSGQCSNVYILECTWPEMHIFVCTAKIGSSKYGYEAHWTLG